MRSIVFLVVGLCLLQESKGQLPGDGVKVNYLPELPPIYSIASELSAEPTRQKADQTEPTRQKAKQDIEAVFVNQPQSSSQQKSQAVKQDKQPAFKAAYFLHDLPPMYSITQQEFSQKSKISPKPLPPDYFVPKNLIEGKPKQGQDQKPNQTQIKPVNEEVSGSPSIQFNEGSNKEKSKNVERLYDVTQINDQSIFQSSPPEKNNAEATDKPGDKDMRTEKNTGTEIKQEETVVNAPPRQEEERRNIVENKNELLVQEVKRQQLGIKNLRAESVDKPINMMLLALFGVAVIIILFGYDPVERRKSPTLQEVNEEQNSLR